MFPCFVFYVLCITYLLSDSVVGVAVGNSLLPTSQQWQSQSLLKEDEPSTKLDTSFYSRQLYVYGKSAQLRLIEGKVAIVNSCPALSHETIKNLALAGVGEITIIEHPVTDRGNDHCYNILGESRSLQEYAQSLNPYIKVRSIKSDSIDDVDDVLKQSTTLIICAKKLENIYVWNARARANGLLSTSAMVTGTVGFVFNDFLDHFDIEDVEGETFKEVLLDPNTVKVVGASTIEINCIDEEVLNVGLGDTVVIKTDHNTSFLLTVEKVLNTKSCLLRSKDKLSYDEIIRLQSSLQFSTHATLQKCKQFKAIHHHSFAREMQSSSPTFNVCNGCLSPKQDWALNMVLFSMMHVMEVLQDGTNRIILQDPRELRLMSKMLLLEELKLRGVADPLLAIKQGGRIGRVWIDYVYDRYMRSFTAPCPATVSVLGSMLAQEAIKSLTKMYQPISQFQFFESLDSLHDDDNGTVNHKSSTSDMSSASGVPANSADNVVPQIYGSEIQKELQGMRVFVVGSGAIGCELLKNFALLGIGSASNSTPIGGSEATNSSKVDTLWHRHGLQEGGILVTDMDLIEKSNLNRQLLFREHHIGQPKSLVAAAQIKQINPNLRIAAVTQRVGIETETDIFTEDFWRETDLVVNALDNIDARKYVDAQCLKHKLVLIDSGTLGTKANLQVVLPFVTETYASSADPPEEALPLCTLKSFPYQPEHCVAWAKAIFEQYLQQDIQNMQTYFEYTAKYNNDKVQEWLDTLSQDERQRVLQNVQDYTPVTSATNNIRNNENVMTKKAFWRMQYQWAKTLFNRLFTQDIAKLLQEHPAGSVDEDGEPFWTGSRRMPSIIIYHGAEQQELHHEFVSSMMFVRAKAWGMAQMSGMDSLEKTKDIVQFIENGEPSTTSTHISNGISSSSNNVNTNGSDVYEWSSLAPRHHVTIAVADTNETSTTFLVTESTLYPSETKADSSDDDTEEDVVPSSSEENGTGMSEQKVENEDTQNRIHPDSSILAQESSELLLSDKDSKIGLQPQVFEKDDLSLGHVAAVASASNLRSRNYALPELDTLEIQRLSGKIIPALATTTSLIAGMVSLEVMKVASERIRQQHHRQVDHKPIATNTTITKDHVVQDLSISSTIDNNSSSNSNADQHQQQDVPSTAMMDNNQESNNKESGNNTDDNDAQENSEHEDEDGEKADAEKHLGNSDNSNVNRANILLSKGKSLFQGLAKRILRANRNNDEESDAVDTNEEMAEEEEDDNLATESEEDTVDIDHSITISASGDTIDKNDVDQNHRENESTEKTFQPFWDDNNNNHKNPAAAHYHAMRHRWLGHTHTYQNDDSNQNAKLEEKEKERLTKRFRNAYVNLALPILSFTQPVLAETNLFDLPTRPLPTLAETESKLAKSIIRNIHQSSDDIAKNNVIEDDNGKNTMVLEKVSLPLTMWDEMYVPELVRYAEELTLFTEEITLHIQQQQQKKKKQTSIRPEKVLKLVQRQLKESLLVDNEAREITLSDLLQYLYAKYPTIHEISSIFTDTDQMLYSNFLPVPDQALVTPLSELLASNTHIQFHSKRNVRLMVTAIVVEPQSYTSTSTINEEEPLEGKEVTFPPLIISVSRSHGRQSNVEQNNVDDSSDGDDILVIDDNMRIDSDDFLQKLLVEEDDESDDTRSILGEEDLEDANLDDDTDDLDDDDHGSDDNTAHVKTNSSELEHHHASTTADDSKSSTDKVEDRIEVLQETTERKEFEDFNDDDIDIIDNSSRDDNNEEGNDQGPTNENSDNEAELSRVEEVEVSSSSKKQERRRRPFSVLKERWLSMKKLVDVLLSPDEDPDPPSSPPKV